MNLNDLKSQSPVAAEYLAQIFFIERDNGSVPNAILADRLKVSRPAVTQAVKRLKKLNLVSQKKYDVICLTQSGRKIAEIIVHRHVLLEHLLSNVLGYPWDKCDDEASSLQTVVSDDFIEHLEKQLGSPQTCPHGNPLPGSPLEKRYLNAPKLIDAADGSDICILRITEEGELFPGLLPFCFEKGIQPGKVLTGVEHSQEYILCRDGSERIEIPREFGIHLCWESVS